MCSDLIYAILVRMRMLLSPVPRHTIMATTLFPSCMPVDDEDEEAEQQQLLGEEFDFNENEVQEKENSEPKATTTTKEKVDANKNTSSMMIMTEEEQEKWLGRYFSTTPNNNNDEEESSSSMSALEKEFEESMHLAASAISSSSKAKNKAENSNIISSSEVDAMRRVYAELHTPADPETIDKLRMAMECIPESVKGLQDCKKYFTSKQHYTLQDILVAQYVLNDGLLMRQNHGADDEYHVDIAEPLV